jgi:integrase
MAIYTRKGKKKTTYLVYYRNPITKKHEYQGFDDEFAAKKYDLEVKERIRKDPLSFSPPDPNQGQVTFKKLAEEYMLKHQLAESTLATTHKTLNAEIFPHIGHMLAEEITKKDLINLLTTWQNKGNSTSTQKRKLCYVTAILNWGYETGRIENRPPRYKIKVGQTFSTPPPTDEEITALFNNAADHLKRVIILGTSLGMRIGRSELLSVKWEDVRWEDKTLIVRSADKGGPKWREVDLTDQLYAVLQKWHQEDTDNLKYTIEYIINYRGKKVGSIKKAWKRAKEDAGITRRIRPYDLRHFFVSRTLAEGADLKAVSEIVGSDPRTLLDTYQHTLKKLKQEAVNRINVLQNCNTDKGPN